MLEPAFRVTVRVRVVQAVQSAVASNATAPATRTPLTAMSIGLFAVVPFA